MASRNGRARILIIVGSIIAIIAGGYGVGRGMLGTGLEAPPRADVSRVEPAVARAIEEAYARTDEDRHVPDFRAAYAIVLHGNAQFEVAAAAYAQALDMAPDRAEWRYLRALALDEIGRSDEAMDELRRAAAAMPSDAAVQARLGFRELDRGAPEAAEKAFLAALRAQPDHLPARLGTLRMAIEVGRAAEARLALEAMLRQRPDAGHIRYLLGLACRSLGDDDCARRELTAGAGSRVPWRGQDPYEDAVILRRVGYLPSLNRAAAAVAARRPDEAIAILESVLDDRPGDLPALMILADAHRAAGRLDDAIALLEAALESDAGHYGVQMNLGRLHELRGDREIALAYTRAAVALNPTLVELRLQEARLLQIDDPAAAEAAVIVALDQAPDSAEALVLLGDLQLRDGRGADAARTFTLLMERRPDLPDGGLRLAALHAAAGRLEPALAMARDLAARFPADSRVAQLVDRLTAAVGEQG